VSFNKIQEHSKQTGTENACVDILVHALKNETNHAAHEWHCRVSTNLPEQKSRRFPGGISRKIQDMFAMLRPAMQC